MLTCQLHHVPAEAPNFLLSVPLLSPQVAKVTLNEAGLLELCLIGAALEGPLDKVQIVSPRLFAANVVVEPTQYLNAVLRVPWSYDPLLVISTMPNYTGMVSYHPEAKDATSTNLAPSVSLEISGVTSLQLQEQLTALQGDVVKLQEQLQQLSRTLRRSR